MRIRKRKVPFPLSSLSPVPLSDPHLSTSSMDQLQLLHNNPLHNFSQDQEGKASFFASQSSDQLNHSIGVQDSSDSRCRKQEESQVLMQEREEEKGGEEEKSNNDTRRGSFFLGAKTPTVAFQESTSFHQADGGRWCEGEKAFPFKKRRRSFERRSNEDTMLMEKDKKMKAKMKTKMNKKCMQQNGIEEAEDNADNKEIKEVIDKSSSSTKKRVRGGALMEGSRCSRVNGRGWRCCQQTLVGYSLCEHHLGKGRLRSMTNVRSRSMASTAPKKPLSTTSLSLEEEETKKISLDDKIGSISVDLEEKQPLLNAKKKQKLGMVKARSISSLLGQANNAIDQATENDE